MLEVGLTRKATKGWAEPGVAEWTVALSLADQPRGCALSGGSLPLRRI